MLPCQQCARYIEGILSRTRKAMLQHVLSQYTLQRGCGGKTRKKKKTASMWVDERVAASAYLTSTLITYPSSSRSAWLPYYAPFIQPLRGRWDALS